MSMHDRFYFFVDKYTTITCFEIVSIQSVARRTGTIVTARQIQALLLTAICIILALIVV